MFDIKYKIMEENVISTQADADFLAACLYLNYTCSIKN